MADLVGTWLSTWGPAIHNRPGVLAADVAGRDHRHADPTGWGDFRGEGVDAVSFRLEADTEWIRRAAATLDEAARDLPPPADGSTVAVGVGSLGSSAEAAATVGLINLRAGQAQEARGAPP